MPKGVFPRSEAYKQKLREKGHGKWNIGKKHSEEWKRNIGLGNKGKNLGRKTSLETKKKLSLARLGNKNNLGHKHSLETRIRMGLSRSGDRNPLWKGGITPLNHKLRTSFEYKLWRESVFKRDNYTCIFCGDNKGGNLEADHIKRWCDYPELRFAIDNGRTLCHDCHIKVHRKNI